jgi:hypothetical protein
MSPSSEASNQKDDTAICIKVNPFQTRTGRVPSEGKNTVVPPGLAVFEKWAFTEEVAGCPTSPRFGEKWATTDLD